MPLDDWETAVDETLKAIDRPGLEGVNPKSLNEALHLAKATTAMEKRMQLLEHVEERLRAVIGVSIKSLHASDAAGRHVKVART